MINDNNEEIELLDFTEEVSQTRKIPAGKRGHSEKAGRRNSGRRKKRTKN